jgi:CheY-like chemotaxis protein
LKNALERLGLDVVVAPDGTEAWAILQRDPGIALTILDWMMPGFDGPEICRRIRRDVSHARMYVILLTSRDASADLVAGLDAGADDYLIKPLESEELRARVQVGLRVHGLQQRLSEQVTELQAALSKVKQLTGLLPICSYCKSVRTDQNYWERVDHYMTQHTDVQFSHGICPACYETVVANLDKEEADNRAAVQQTPE